MLFSTIAQRVGVSPNFSTIVLMFFAYSLIGYILECIVLTLEKRQFVYNRGFVRHLPFCIIYGFGAFAGYAILSPFANNWLMVFVIGAAGASVLELITAKIQIRLFGTFWWDYSKKPLNYKGILCLESTLGWGLAALIIVNILHPALGGLISRVPTSFAVVLSVLLMLSYVTDFLATVHRSLKEKYSDQEYDGNWELKRRVLNFLFK